MTQEAKEILVNKGEKLGIRINNDKLESFCIYANLLKEKNRQMNLTAITQDKDIAIKHFLDSLTILPFIKTKEAILLDMGTGAGLPGLPLKIMMPSLNILLVDSLAKRINFLNEVIYNLDLKGINTLHARAEDLGKNREYREKYDYVTARALAPMPILLEYCLPLVKVGGSFIAMKGSKREDSYQKALSVLGGREEKVHTLCLEDEEESMKRLIYIFKKERETPTNFPRKAGYPSKHPL